MRHAISRSVPSRWKAGDLGLDRSLRGAKTAKSPCQATDEVAELVCDRDERPFLSQPLRPPPLDLLPVTKPPRPYEPYLDGLWSSSFNVAWHSIPHPLSRCAPLFDVEAPDG